MEAVQPVLFKFPLPPTNPGPAPVRYKGSKGIAVCIVAIDLASIPLTATFGPLPYVARLVFGGAAAAFFCLGDSEEDYAKNKVDWERRYKEYNENNSVIWLDLTVENEFQILEIHDMLAKGAYSPSTEIRVLGNYDQQIVRTYSRFHEATKKPVKKQYEFLAHIIEAGKKIESAAKLNVIEAASVVKVSIDYIKENAEIEHKRAILHHEVSAYVIGDFIYNGVNLIHNDGQSVLLRWGTRDEHDIKIKNPNT